MPGLVERHDAQALIADFGLLIEELRCVFPAKLHGLVLGPLKASRGAVEVGQIGHAKTVLLHGRSLLIPDIPSWE